MSATDPDAALSGRSLRRWQAESHPAWPEVLAAYLLAGRHLAALHGQGRAHGAIDADHLRIDDARRVDLGAPAVPRTRTDAAIATAADDQRAWCAALWEALAGAPPLPGAARPPRRPRALRELFPLLTRGLASDPAERWASVDALLHAIERGPQRPQRGATGPRIAKLVIVVTLISGALFTTLLGHSCGGSELDPRPATAPDPR